MDETYLLPPIAESSSVAVASPPNNPAVVYVDTHNPSAGQVEAVARTLVTIRYSARVPVIESDRLYARLILAALRDAT